MLYDYSVCMYMCVYIYIYIYIYTRPASRPSRRSAGAWCTLPAVEAAALPPPSRGSSKCS